MRSRATTAGLLRWLPYVVVPVCTFGVEDAYLVRILGYRPGLGQFVIERSGITPADLVGLALLAVTVPLWWRRRSRTDLKVFGLLAVAVVVSGVYGLLRGPASDYRLFEPSLWKTLVPLFALTVALTALFEEPAERERFLTWFCAWQFVLAVTVLAPYLAVGRGQPAYFEAVVPVFAGDMLVFMTVAYAICLFRLAKRWEGRRGRQPPASSRHRREANLGAGGWRLAAAACGAATFALVLLLSLRRSFMAPVLSAPILFVGVVWVRGRRRRGTLRQTALLGVLLSAVAWLFFGFLGPLRLSRDLILGRFKSLDPFWADQQITDPFFGSVGHTEDFLDGLETVLKSPVLGQGLAVWFPLPRTGDWQEANVHAGVFRIWIKLGLIGVAGYVLLFGRGLRLLGDLGKSGDINYRFMSPDFPQRLFAVWFAIHFLAMSIYMNGILFGYKNSVVVAMYLGLCTALLAERSRAAARLAHTRPAANPLRGKEPAWISPS